MDPNFQKCTFLAFLSIELCACNLIFAAFSVIEVPPIIIERLLNKGVLPETPNGAL